MPIGKKDVSAHVARKKPRRSQLRGFSIPLCVGVPKVDYQLFLSVQLFVDVVGSYTCSDRFGVEWMEIGNT